MTGREGRLSWEARAEEVSFEVLPKRFFEKFLNFLFFLICFRMNLLIISTRSSCFGVVFFFFFFRKITFIHSFSMTTTGVRVGEPLIRILQLYIYVKV